MNMHTNALRPILAALSLAACASTLSSCYFRFTDKAREDLKRESNWISASSETDTLTFFPGEFSGIQHDGSMDLFFIQSEGEPKVFIETASNLIDSLAVEVVEIDGERILRISYTCRTQNAFNEVAHISAPSLRRVDLRGSGDLQFNGTFQGDSLTIDTRGSGDVLIGRMELAGDLLVESVGSGDVEADYLQTGSLVLSSRGSGDIKVKGSGGKISATSNGSGDIEAERFVAREEGAFSQFGSGKITYTTGDTSYILEDGKKKQLKTYSATL